MRPRFAIFACNEIIDDRIRTKFNMSEDFDKTQEEQDNLPEGREEHSDYKPADKKDENVKHQLSGMYQNWFLDYASYVILERAVPHIMDGLKPVQRRILHSMRRMEDGRYNKVANIVGHTMQFHPHGDASIGDALVQLGQKDLLIDCQGNWGNILTGDSAAAPRYIEARLSRFALDVVFNPKTTEWKLSYDGRNREPVTLPVKFPLLLAQGVEGIAVGLSSKILPHNFNELCDAAISYLHGEDFRLCIVTEPEDEHGNPEKQIQFYERLNGIGVTTGEDLFGSRLHMRERWAEVRYLSHEAWNQGGTAGAARAPVGVSEEQFCDFIDEMYAAEFEYVYESTPDFYTDSSRAQAHLYVRMEDETVVELRLFEGGYVGYQHMGWYFVKMPGAAFDAVFAGCR